MPPLPWGKCLQIRNKQMPTAVKPNPPPQEAGCLVLFLWPLSNQPPSRWALREKQGSHIITPQLAPTSFSSKILRLQTQKSFLKQNNKGRLIRSQSPIVLSRGTGNELSCALKVSAVVRAPNALLWPLLRNTLTGLRAALHMQYERYGRKFPFHTAYVKPLSWIPTSP